jgi:hypothetical protein
MVYFAIHGVFTSILCPLAFLTPDNILHPSLPKWCSHKHSHILLVMSRHKHIFLVAMYDLFMSCCIHMFMKISLLGYAIVLIVNLLQVFQRSKLANITKPTLSICNATSYPQQLFLLDCNEDGSSKLLWNVGNKLPLNMTSCSRRS